MKYCHKCEQEKPTTEFYKDKRRKDGLTPYCKPCHCSYKTIEGNKKATQTYHQKKKLEDPVMFMWKRAKHRAQYDYKGMEFTIQKEDIILPERCPYFDVPFLPLDKRWGYSLDRIDSSKGYIPGNVEVISRLANTMKNNATADALVKFAEGILRRQKEVVAGASES